MTIHILTYFIIFKMHYILLIYVLKCNVNKNYHFIGLYYIAIHYIKSQSRMIFDI
jgi:hypothetical protein